MCTVFHAHMGTKPSFRTCIVLERELEVAFQYKHSHTSEREAEGLVSRSTVTLPYVPYSRVLRALTTRHERWINNAICFD